MPFPAALIGIGTLFRAVGSKTVRSALEPHNSTADALSAKRAKPSKKVHKMMQNATFENAKHDPLKKWAHFAQNTCGAGSASLGFHFGGGRAELFFCFQTP